MSNREQEIMENIAKSLPDMSEFQKGYLLGTAEAMAERHKEEKEREEQAAVV